MAHQSHLIASDIEQYLKSHETKGLLRFSGPSRIVLQPAPKR